MRNVNVAVEVKIPSATKVKAHSVCIFNRLSKEGDYTVRLYIYFLIDQYFFEECSDFENFLLSSIYIRRKYWIRENFRLPVFDGFTCFEMS